MKRGEVGFALAREQEPPLPGGQVLGNASAASCADFPPCFRGACLRGSKHDSNALQSRTGTCASGIPLDTDKSGAAANNAMELELVQYRQISEIINPP